MVLRPLTKVKDVFVWSSSRTRSTEESGFIWIKNRRSEKLSYDLNFKQRLLIFDKGSPFFSFMNSRLFCIQQLPITRWDMSMTIKYHFICLMIQISPPPPHPNGRSPSHNSSSLIQWNMQPRRKSFLSEPICVELSSGGKVLAMQSSHCGHLCKDPSN